MRSHLQARRMILLPALALALAVGDASICQLLTLESGGKAPAACSSSG
jgi:hypothetical protein